MNPHLITQYTNDIQTEVFVESFTKDFTNMANFCKEGSVSRGQRDIDE